MENHWWVLISDETCGHLQETLLLELCGGRSDQVNLVYRGGHSVLCWIV